MSLHWFGPRKPKESLADQYGMFMLHNPDQPTAGIIDIVAVHGLNGHYSDTWKWSSQDGGTEQNWLKDFLPQQISNARIMSYGYNSAVQFSKSTAGINIFADQLLNAIMTERSTTFERSRPLIFICHSLGGLVFKKALIRANERDDLKPLLERIQGVAFLGTPHRGSNLANWGDVFATVLTASALGINTNRKVVRELRSQYEGLHEITVSSVERLRDLDRILSFFETEMMPGMNCLVVDQQSGTLSFPNEKTYPMSADHRTICKFASITGPQYRIVSAAIRDMIDAILSRNSAADQADLARAVAENNEQLVEILLDRGANPDYVNPEGYRPLFVAAHKGYAGIIKLLLKSRRGVNINARNPLLGETALHQTAIYGKDEAGKILLDHGANIEEGSGDGWTPLHEAANFFASATFIQMLLDRGANVNAKTGEGTTALHLAAGNGNVEKMKVLLKGGASIDALDNEDRTPESSAKAPAVEFLRSWRREHPASPT